MPAKSNPVHMDAFPPLRRLSTHATTMSQDATRKPLTFDQRHQLTQLAISALKASDVSQADVLNAVSAIYGNLANGTSLKPAPASVPMAEDEKGRLVPANSSTAVNPTPEKKGGLFR